MRHSLTVLVAILLLWTARASAEPVVLYQVLSTGELSVSLRDVQDATACSLSKFSTDSSPLQLLKQPDGSWTPSGESAWAFKLALDDRDTLPIISCKLGDTPQQVKAEVTISDTVKLPVRVDPASGLTLAKWFQDALGTLQSCSMGTQACVLDGARLQPTSIVASGSKLEAKFKNKKVVTLLGRVEECRFVLESPAWLVQNSKVSQVRIVPQGLGCYLSGRLTLKREGSTDVDLTPISNAAGYSNGYSVRLPPDIPTGTIDWTIEEQGSGRSGKLTARVLPAPRRASEELRVTYANPALDRIQEPTSANGIALAIPDWDPSNDVARTTGSWRESPKDLPIRNVVRLLLPPELAVFVDDVAATNGTQSTGWQIVNTTWDEDVLFRCGREAHARAATPANPCLLTGLQAIEFGVIRRRMEPLEVRLRFVRKERPASPPTSQTAPPAAAPSPTSPPPSQPDEVMLETSVVLANSARVESIPFPAARFLNIKCSCSGNECSAAALSGQTRAVGHNDLQESKCKAVLDLSPETLRGAGVGDPSIYGPQTLIVSVTPEGGATTAARWEVLLKDKANREFTLPTPATQAAGGEYYTVQISVAARQAAQVQYRAGTTQLAEVGEATNVRRSELVYEARLRSRGVYGIDGKFRVFVTIPVEVAAVRFPARGDELTRSSESPNYQFMAPVVGALVGLEPWDYDSGRNRWAFPMRALAGIHARKVRDQVELASVLGVAATFPVIDAPSELGSSLALGAYGSVDLAPSNRAFRDRMSLVVTLGFNFLSLFSGR